MLIGRNVGFGYYDDASEELTALRDLENNSSDNCTSDSENDSDNISNNERPRIQCKNNLDLHTPYKTSGQFVNNEDGTETCVYNDKSIYDELTKSQKYSLHLRQLISEFGVPRECYRKVVRLINTIIKDHDAMMEGSGSSVEYLNNYSIIILTQSSFHVYRRS